MEWKLVNVGTREQAHKSFLRTPPLSCILNSASFVLIAEIWGRNISQCVTQGIIQEVGMFWLITSLRTRLAMLPQKACKDEGCAYYDLL